MLFVTCLIAIALDVTVQQFKESPGLYFDNIGQAHLYNIEWKVVTYTNLETVDYSFRIVRNYAQMSTDICNRHEHKFWVNFTGCLNNIRQSNRPIKEVSDLKLILRRLTRNGDEFILIHNKRGVFNFIV